ncbi:synaptonemal complex protein 2-like [Elysia marginata]|uniref:Synaptonemal complex protein 2-like n=1 Tax=Elysia marginata TaxID=1093978 RepID=A0AAV4I8T0_9GAST|nr:synaptonemal complex protein 2-like [Elysia marginata]
MDDFPATIISEGLNTKRQWYLYEEIRQFVDVQKQDLVAPLPLVSKPGRRVAADSDIEEEVVDHQPQVVNSLGKKVKNSFRVALLGDFLNFISHKSIHVLYRLEILKSINNLLENFPVSLLQKLLSTDDFVKKIECFLKTLIEAGDYEFQVCAIECFNRVVTKDQKAKILRKTGQTSFVTEILLSIRVDGGHFETDCRAALNKLNAQNSSVSSRVYTFQAESVKIDEVRVR